MQGGLCEGLRYEGVHPTWDNAGAISAQRIEFAKFAAGEWDNLEFVADLTLPVSALSLRGVMRPLVASSRSATALLGIESPCRDKVLVRRIPLWRGSLT